jgi:hypothetical protein
MEECRRGQALHFVLLSAPQRPDHLISIIAKITFAWYKNSKPRNRMKDGFFASLKANAVLGIGLLHDAKKTIQAD